MPRTAFGNLTKYVTVTLSGNWLGMFETRAEAERQFDRNPAGMIDRVEVWLYRETARGDELTDKRILRTREQSTDDLD